MKVSIKTTGQPYHAYHFNCLSCGIELRSDARQVKGDLYCLKCHCKMGVPICGASRRPIKECVVRKRWHVDLLIRRGNLSRSFTILVVVVEVLLSHIILVSPYNRIRKGIGGEVNIRPAINGDLVVNDQSSSFTGYNTSELPGCPSNRTEAAEKGRKCSRKCRHDMPCMNFHRKSCLCDGICGWSCLKPDLNCQELKKPTAGYFYPKSNVLNTKVRYECEPGYYLFGPRERICQGDEEWSDFTPECLTRPACKAPTAVSHARKPNEGYYRVGDKVTYTCYSGYDSYGSNETICALLSDKNSTAWIWSGPEFKCIPKSCGDPGQLANGRRKGESFIVASTVEFSCDEGWQRVGPESRYCQADGRWSGHQPHCEQVVCNHTDHLKNGTIKYDRPLIFNSSVTYACNKEFRLVGPKYRVCGLDSKLIGDMPHCEEIDCGDLGPLYNGHINGSNSKIGDKKYFFCNEGTIFVGESNETTCLDTGQWSHLEPQCLGRCAVPNFDNSKLISILPPSSFYTNKTDTNDADRTNNNRTLTTTVIGQMTTTKTKQIKTTLTLALDTGNKEVKHVNIDSLLTSISKLNAAMNRSFEKPKSKKKSPPIYYMMYLKYEPSSFFVNHGQFLYYRCDAGFEPIEMINQTIVIEPPACDNSSWTYLPRCVPAKCREYPSGPKNSMALLTDFDHGAKARFRCLDGYRLKGPDFVICDHGNWTTAELQCEELYCAYPGTIENGRVLLQGHMGSSDYRPYIESVTNNRQIAYECETGYHLNDSALLGATCLNGQWRPEQLPQCIKG